MERTVLVRSSAAALLTWRGQARIVVGVLDLGPIEGLGPIGHCKAQIEPQYAFVRLEIGGRCARRAERSCCFIYAIPTPRPSGPFSAREALSKSSAVARS
jgi:hypothetical protein